MSDSEERTIAVARQVNRYAGPLMWTRWDIFFTDRRVISFKTGDASDFVSLCLWGELYWLPEVWCSRRKSIGLQGIPPQEILAMDAEMDYFEYSELEFVRVLPRFLISSEIIIKPWRKTRRRYWGRRGSVQTISKVSALLRSYGVPIG
jgi:hypothetical protein